MPPVPPTLPLNWPYAMYHFPQNVVLLLCFLLTILIRYFNVRQSTHPLAVQLQFFEFLHFVPLDFYTFLSMHPIDSLRSGSSLRGSTYCCLLTVVSFASLHPTVQTRVPAIALMPLAFYTSLPMHLAIATWQHMVLPVVFFVTPPHGSTSIFCVPAIALLLPTFLNIIHP